MDLHGRLPDPGVIRRVNERFYELVFEHPWLSRFFEGVDQEHITSQQTDFMTGAFGGPRNFSGRPPSHAHPHLFITDEVFDLRRDLLTRALAETQAPEELREAWLRVDEAFRAAIVKGSVSECSGRWRNDRIVVAPDPRRRSA